MSFKSILKPEGSVVAAIATVAVVYGLYQTQCGPVAQARATDANHPVLESSRKKAGYTAIVAVAALTLITKDPNVGILGGGAIIAMELSYRTGIMAEPMSGKLQNPNPESAYSRAENVYAFPQQGETG